MSDLVSGSALGYLALYARLVVGATLLFAGVVKARNTSSFVTTIQEFRLLPTRFAKGTAAVIVTAEIVLGWLLLVGLFTQLAAIGGSLVFAIFTIAIGINLARHNIVRCNCFGPYFSQRINARTVMRNLVLLGLCVSTLLFFDGAFALDSMIGISSTVHHHSLPLVILPIAVFVLGLLVVLTAKQLFMTSTREA